MPTANEQLAYLDDLEPFQLEAERQRLLSLAPEGDYKRLDDDSLVKLWRIYATLRRKSPAASARRKTTKQPRSLDEFV